MTARTRRGGRHNRRYIHIRRRTVENVFLLGIGALLGAILRDMLD